MYFEYLLRQLEFAHKRNELCDRLRFIVLQVFFGFQTIVLSAIVFGQHEEGARYFDRQLGDMSLVVPIMVFVIGFGLFGIFVQQHAYMLKYKTWASNLECSLCNVVFLDGEGEDLADIEHTGTLYHDSNKPRFRPEPTLVLTLFVMGVMNLATTALVLNVIGASMTTKVRLCSLFSGVAPHILLLFCVIRFSRGDSSGGCRRIRE